MNNKGFSLIELLGVVTILGILGVIIVPTINTVISNNKQVLYETQIRNIESATSNYASDNVFKLNIPNNSSVGIHLGYLKSLGYIDNDISDPITRTKFSDQMVILITNRNNLYSYTVCDGSVTCDINVDFLDNE